VVKVNSNRLSFVLIAAGSLMLVAAVTLMALIATDVIDNTRSGNSDLETITTFGEPIQTPTVGPSPTPSAEFPPGSDAPIARLVIPAAEIDAPVVIKGVDFEDRMESPDNAYDTAWYDFSARPGSDGNAVFSGHVDYIRVGKAVFWNLKDLEQGDIVEVRLEDGSTYRYAVTSKQVYDADTAPVNLIVGPTERQTVTLITCSGTFDSSSHQYDKRLVVRAERVPEGGEPADAPST
jgi:LPXTG-site transpeptidase (sortase) family protein